MWTAWGARAAARLADGAVRDPLAAAAVAAAPSAGQARLRRAGAELDDEPVNGWIIPRGRGAYDGEYARRAFVAFLGPGANLDADGVYPRAMVDGEGRALGGGSPLRPAVRVGPTAAGGRASGR